MGASDEVAVPKPRADNFNCCNSLLQIQQDFCLKENRELSLLFVLEIPPFFGGGVLNIDRTSFAFWCSFIKNFTKGNGSWHCSFSKKCHQQICLLLVLSLQLVQVQEGGGKSYAS